jgi:3D (Asp-Asp-Asp) domain-containing protein
MKSIKEGASWAIVALIFVMMIIFGLIFNKIQSSHEEKIIKQTDTVVVYAPLTKEVTVTVYHAVESQCDSTPLITANGTKINPVELKNDKIHYCAVSRDLLEELPYGSKIYIEGHGEYEVVDTMNRRIVNTVDILQDVNKPIFKKSNIKIIKVK